MNLSFFHYLEATRQDEIPVAILCNKYDAVTESSTGGASSGGGCLTLENVCVALAVDALQVCVCAAATSGGRDICKSCTLSVGLGTLRESFH